MTFFRDPSHTSVEFAPGASVQDLDTLRLLLVDVLRPVHFFVDPSITLEWEYQPQVEESWEIFQGRLLDPAQTRRRQTFETWNVFLRDAGGRSAEPVLSLKLDRVAQRLHVTRAIQSHAWEGYDAGDNVFLGRETRKWVRELVGSIHLRLFSDANCLRDELIGLLFQAVIGTSRLPLTSVEAPLPAFSFGKLAYVYRSDLGASEKASQPLRSFRDLIQKALGKDLAWLEKAKLLEAVLRTLTPQDVGEAAELFAIRWGQLGHTAPELNALLRTLFNEVALSPYTDFVDTTLAWVQSLVDKGYLSGTDEVDFLSYLLRQIGRHLTAYDLITFHHRGANYPDALLLDAVLRAYRQRITCWPELFLRATSDGPLQQDRKRVRRRALRQAWMLRCRYQGLPVPDFPTSAGENLRVLPLPYGRVPEEQIVEPAKRSKRLFAGSALELSASTAVAEALQQSMADLEHPTELQELGRALFLDRPLGLFKAPTEPDQTLLFSYEAYSARIAEQRLEYLAQGLGLLSDPAAYEAARRRLRSLGPSEGVELPLASSKPRPGVVSLQDAQRIAPDFRVQRTTRRTVQDLLALFDFAPIARFYSLDYLHSGRRVLILDEGSGTARTAGVLTIYDAIFRKRMELQVDPSLGYERRAGQEYPAAGLRVLRIWQAAADDGTCVEHDLRGEALVVRPRSNLD
jgi:hypothetical protein